MKLDFSKLKKNTENQQPTNTPQVDPTTQTGIKLSFTEGKTYDLDEIIANKLRDNENGTLVLRTIGDIQFRNRMIELVTKKILDDYGVEWTEDNWKLAETLAKVNNFSRVFDAYFTRYYEEYKKVINSGNFEGSFSIDTILRTIKLTKEDIRKYTLTDVCEHQTEFLNYSDRNRPLIIWTDGTNDCGCGDNGKSYDKLASDIKTTKELANNTKENLDANYYTKLEIEDKLDNLEISDEKLQSYYNKTETDKKIEDYTAENFYNKGEIDTKLSSFSPDNVYTKTEADSTFAKKTELETVTEHVKELPISTFNNDANYVTEENAATKADIETAKANIQSDMDYLNTYHSNQAWKDLDQFTINGEIVNPVDGVVSLLADGSSYTLSGYLRGCIEIGREFYGLEKGGDGITLVLNNVYIDSPYTSGIVYLAPKKKMTIKIEDDSYNYIYCGTKDISGMEKETTDFRGAIYSFNNMLVSGTGYLTIENIKGTSGLGHGIKASELEIIGKPNIYVKSNHDAFHAGKKLIVGNGVFTVEQANDAFGTGDNGYILIFGGKYNLSGIASGQNCFDSNQQGYILNQKANFNIITNVSESYIYKNIKFIDDSDFASSFESPKIEYYSVSEVGGEEIPNREAVVDSFPDTQYTLSTNNNYTYNTSKKALTIYVYGNFADKEIIIPANTTDLVIDKVNIKLVNAIVGRIQTSADKTQVKLYDLEDESKVNILYNSSKSPLYLDDDLNINNDCPIVIIGNGTDSSVNSSELDLKGSGYKHIENLSENASAQGTAIYIGGDKDGASKNSAGGVYIKKLHARLSGKGKKGTINIYSNQTNPVIIKELSAATSAVNEGNTYVLNDVASNVTGFKKLNQPYESVKKYFSVNENNKEEKELFIELMSLPYTGPKANVYFSGAVETVMETALGDKFKNPMDLDEWSRLIADEPCGVIEHYADLPDNPKNVFFYGVTENNKLYNYSEDSKTWNDVTEAAQINFNIVYIGDDVSKVGTLDKNIYDGSGGVYIIHYRVSHPELKTNVIYKVPDFEKSIYTTNNKTVIYGTEFPLGTSNEINDLKVPEIADLIKSKNLNITDSILFEIGMCRTYGFLGPIDFDENDEQNREHTIHRVLFEKGKYILYLYNKKYSNNIPTYSIYREFNSLEDFSDFMLNSSDFVIKKDDVDLITIIRAVIKTYKITPIFTNSSLNDNNIAVNNVIGADFEKKIYKFYIYNGEEFIELKTSNSYSNGGYSQKYNFKNISATASSSDVSKIISIDMSSLASVENYSILLSKITRLWENENIFSLSIRVKSSVVERYCINIMAQCTLIDMYDTASNSRGLVPNACFRFVGSDNIDGYVILNSNPLLKFCFSTEDMYNTFKAIATNLFATMSISFGLNVL